MKLRVWHVISVVAVGVSAFLVSSTVLPDEPDIAIVSADSKAEVSSHLPPLAWLMYDVVTNADYTPSPRTDSRISFEKAEEFYVRQRASAPAVLASFWVFIDILVISLFSWIPVYFSTTGGKRRTVVGIVLSMLLILLSFGIIDFIAHMPVFEIFLDFGIHLGHGLGIDLSSIETALYNFLISIILVVTNLILMSVCVVQGNKCRLMGPVWRFKQSQVPRD